uniref:CCHC-type domain-containing protein n=1 Tax=Ascaris lumbricoides TaxID=6252 RepID=A0A0M3HXF1_ASCLU
MSKALRKTISIEKRSLFALIQEAHDFTVNQPDPQLPFDDQIAALDQQRRQLLNHRTRIEQRITAIKQHHDRWLALLETTSNPVDEIAFYEQVTDDPDNFLEVLMTASDATADLTSHIDHLTDTIAAATARHNATPPFIQPPQALFPSPTNRPLYDIRLPKLQLKPFHGDLAQWPQFKATFQAAVGNNPNVSPIQKLNYLLNSLEGAAARAVTGYALLPENYDIVWDALEQQFGSPEAIVNSLYTQLENLPKADHDIRATVDELECILRQLETQGQDLETPLIHRTIEKKLPHWVILHILDEKEKSSHWSVRTLRETLRKLALKRDRARQICRDLDSTRPNTNATRPLLAPATRQQSRPTPNQPPRSIPTHKPPYISAFSVSTVRQRPTTSLPRSLHCAFCGDGHWSDQCKKYATAQEHTQTAIEKRLCFNCLREGHGARNCAKKKECFHCKKRGHSSALCKERATLTRRFLPTSTRVQAANTTQEGSVTAKETKSDEEIKMIATTVIRSKDRQETTRGDTTLTTLLLCKEVLVSNPNDPRRAAVVTAFFDSGCQGTFVTNELVKKLQLEANSLQKLTICGFGSKDPRIYDSKQVVLNIHLKNGSAKQVEAKSIERITQKIQTVDLTREDLDGLEHEEAAKLTLPTKWKAPSVVVGVDYYHQFFTGVTKHFNFL